MERIIAGLPINGVVAHPAGQEIVASIASNNSHSFTIPLPGRSRLAS
jgi:hypothetical protein